MNAFFRTRPLSGSEMLRHIRHMARNVLINLGREEREREQEKREEKAGSRIAWIWEGGEGGEGRGGEGGRGEGRE